MTWWKPWTWIGDPKWTALSGLPTVQFRAVSLVGLDYLTLAGMVFTIVWLLTHPTTPADHVIVELWGLWFALLGGMHGINAKAYSIKRRTSSEGNLTEDASDAPLMTQELPTTRTLEQNGAPVVTQLGGTTIVNPPAVSPPIFARQSPAEPSD